MEKIDLTKLLEDCPKGMPLDCAIFDNATLYNIESNKDNEYPIRIETTNGHFMDFTKYGTYTDAPEAKCLIFPKGKTTWEGFQIPFIAGDIVFYNDTIAIFKEWGDETLFRAYVAKGLNCKDLIGINTPLFGKSVRNEIRFATEEEKQILFKALEENGYKWNSKTKTLEELIVPKFKVGDTIRSKKNSLQEYKITDVSSEYYSTGIGSSCASLLPIKDQDDFILVPNRFDITSLQPFDKVLVRQYNVSAWCTDFYSYYDDEMRAVCTGDVHYDHCIPYNEDTKHLVGKLKDAPEFYKYWEAR